MSYKIQEKLLSAFGKVLLVFWEKECAPSDVVGCIDNDAEFMAGDVGFKASDVEYEILFKLSRANDNRFCWKKET